MNDHRALNLAREWSAAIDRGEGFVSQDWIDAAADTINALPDGWVDADKLRELLDEWEGRSITSDAYRLYRELEALLPAPKPRPEDVPVGEAWQLKVGDDDCIGYRSDAHGRIPWAVLYPDNKLHDYMFDEEVTLVARLVPDQGADHE